MKRYVLFFVIASGLFMLLTLPSCWYDRDDHEREEWREHERGEHNWIWSSERQQEREEQHEAAPVMHY